ncbi:DUF3168 domain-containing protein [Bradyrhizobium sp. SEMIA]|uniref:DUF3168 domain-containing protein n=1 Tax=Bradyrhizobium sp. SEMIA TaxID=2597515 RepID=UPI0018A44F7D|nr:DUF3168 domain-containing protein [Bradyrhizobium sp. SEMIA]QOG20461.1 DUF3168 domain-containing protein [Bradyrhizobium sp. SEMIA]
MLTDPTSAIWDAVKARLLSDPDIASVFADRVYDKIQNTPTFPYISLGAVQVLPELGEGIDAAEVFLTLNSWTRFTGSDALRSGGKYLIAALHDEELQIEGGAVLSILLESSRTIPDPDGVTKHGVYTFQILTDANVL